MANIPRWIAISFLMAVWIFTKILPATFILKTPELHIANLKLCSLFNEFGWIIVILTQKK